jgi:hypothetical protein
MARRWIVTAIVTAVLVVAAVAAARAIRDDTNTAARDRVTTSTTAPSTTAPTITGAGSTTTAPTTGAPAPTATTVAPATGQPPGPCGTDTGAIRAAIDTGVAGAQTGADITACRLAASDTTWAAAQLAARPGAQFDARTVILHRTAASWAIVATGGTNAGCGQAPQQVIVDLGQFCAGTGGGA